MSSFAAVGIPQEDIARVLDIDAKTLRKHYRRELDTGATLANAAIGGALFTSAKKGNITAQIWWTKARMGWRGNGPVESEDEAALAPVTRIEYREVDASVVPLGDAEDEAA